MRIYDFRIEYEKNPQGISVRNPRFSWKMESERENTVQTSYRLRVCRGEKCVWDSGKESSGRSVLVPYAGEELEPETRYEVSLSVTDNYGNVCEADTWFETGIFDTETFRARMITHDFPDEETACPVFYRDFRVQKPVKKARIYATAHGVYELYLNGSRVEAFAEIRIWYDGGGMEVIATDESWKVRTGSIRYSEIYMGETIDTDQPEIREGSVTAVPFDRAVLTYQESEPVRVTERIGAKSIFRDPKGNLLVDFGQNITGLVFYLPRVPLYRGGRHG